MNLRVPERKVPSERISRSKSDAVGLRSEDGLGAVESLIHRLVTRDVVDRLTAMALEQLNRGGRRVRARLSLAAGRALGAKEADAVAWAASVEILHNATLVHDDIQDGDTLRRGRPTVWAQHGVAQAINAGDFLLMLPYLALSELDPRHQGPLALLLAETSTRIVRGQVHELGLLENERLDRSDYYAAARGKTGALFELPVAGAAILADAPPKLVRELGALFGKLGLVFQLQDDIVDLYGDKGREEKGSDIREGKVSALIVELVRLRPELQKDVVRILRKPRNLTTVEDVQFISEECRASGALDAVLDTVDEILDEIESFAEDFDNVGVRALVDELTRLSLEPLECVGFRRATLSGRQAR
jgi:geranylgeranyl diphosphate synthase, type I